jgi:hypothetical protein
VEKSLVYLEKRETGEAIEAELWDDISDEHVGLWRATWLPLVEEAKARLTNEGIPRSKWPQDLHWDWSQKTDWSRALLSLQRFAITCEGSLQGLMMVNFTKLTARLPSQRGKDLAYVEFVATAPWNRPELTREPKFRGLGSTMVRTAIEASAAEGFRGRIGLHSLPQSENFYGDRDKCGMTNLGPDVSCYNLAYFEMTEAQAAEFCNRGTK